jgi:hypothetical protein
MYPARSSRLLIFINLMFAGRYPIFAGRDTGRARQIPVAGRYRCEIALNSVWEQVGAIK